MRRILLIGLWSSIAPLIAAAEPPHHPGGFWKCRTNNAVVSPEFGGEDPVGLASGKHIPTDCAIHWSDGHGRTYCFASLPSLNFFDSELGLRDKARAFWTEERAARDHGAAAKP